jgi:hypothetical protein
MSFSRESVVAAVSQAIADTNNPKLTIRDYTTWARQHQGQPSHATVMKMCGTWVDAVRMAGGEASTRGRRRQPDTSSKEKSSGRQKAKTPAPKQTAAAGAQGFSDRPLVYIDSPVTDPVASTHSATVMAEALVQQGFTPLVPGMTILLQFIAPHDQEFWDDYRGALMRRCDAVLRLPHPGRKSNAVADRASQAGIPVFDNIDDLRGWGELRVSQRQRQRKRRTA